MSRSPFERLHELGLKLIGLAALTVATFAFTSVVAAERRRTTLADASALHQRGVQALAAGDLSAARDHLRRASLRDRDNAGFSLDFARALAKAGERDLAERQLLALRDRQPDSAEVNLALARLAATADDVPMALRYYRYALYAPWSDADAPRRVRDELVRFLLSHGDRTRALSELMAARASVPETVEARRQLGERFLEAGDTTRALEELRHALNLAPADTAARALAGRAAYESGDYRAALRYLDGIDAPVAVDMRMTASAVLRDDPLAPRILPSERRDRMLRMLAVVRAHRESCPQAATDAPPGDLEAVVSAVRRTAGRDQDLLEHGVDVAYAEMMRLADRCPPRTPAERALVTIGARHEATP